MSYSYDFCKERIKSKDVTDFDDINFSKATEYIINDNFPFGYFNERQYQIATGGSIKTKIIHDPNCQCFQYFTSKRLYTDGTLYFVAEAIQDLLQRVFICNTYYKPSGIPNDGDFLVYTIGNPVVVGEVSNKFAPEGKPWMTDRVTVMLPIFFERRCDDF